jgi:hypothetical protein
MFWTAGLAWSAPKCPTTIESISARTIIVRHVGMTIATPSM